MLNWDTNGNQIVKLYITLIQVNRLQQLHRLGFVHGDIKNDNILVGSNNP